MFKFMRFVALVMCTFGAAQYVYSSDIEQELFEINTDILPDIYRSSAETPIVHEIDEAARLSRPQHKKDWTFIVYMAADNDLRNFAIRNIKQMVQIGSNKHINIVVHIDIRITGNYKITRRYYIEKNKIIHINANDPQTQQMDSGDPKTLVSCCKWAIEDYPADNYALVFWNHGTGPVDPGSSRIINPSELFTFNPATCKLELDRSVGFLDLMCHATETGHRGVCWDDSTGHYLTNSKLDAALSEICTKHLGGKKFNIIAFDACLMATVEIGNIIKKYSNIMVGSQEVELGTGWNYSETLALFEHQSLDQYSFAQQMVDAYARAYSTIMNDFTQSAVALNYFDFLEFNINNVARHLIECLKNQRNNSVKSAIRASRSKFLCTHFEEPSYIDLHHFYINLQENLRHFNLIDQRQETTLKQELYNLIEEGKRIIEEVVIRNSVGKNLPRASGLSIYFPERILHPSYPQNSFASSNAWTAFITHYLNI